MIEEDLEITESELEWGELYFDTQCMAETLFSNADNLSYFDENKFIELRLYQLLFLSWEYGIFTDVPGLDDKQQFALRKNTADCITLAARLLGKCESYYNECILANGKIVQFKDLIGKTAKVFSLNDDWKMVLSTAKFSDNGEKECWELTTDSGKQITVTAEHPFLTGEGWKPIKDLKIKEYIATPRVIPTVNKKSVDENIAKLLGYLIGDGTCSNQQIGFTNINNELIKEFKELVKYFDCEWAENGMTYWVKKNNNYRRKQYVKGVGYIPGERNIPNEIKKLVMKYGIDKLSKEKEIPKQVFQWSNKYIGILLNRLFACDGTVNKKGRGIEIVLASKKMIYQIQHLLLRFGISSSIYFKKAKCNGKFFNAWRLFIGNDSKKFIENIGIKSKDKKFWKYYTIPKVRMGSEIPKNLFISLYDLFEGNKYKWRLAGWKLYNTCREKWQWLAKKTNFPQVNKVAYSDIYWDRIKEIKYVGKIPTVAVSVDKFHNYISNNIISHNSWAIEKIDICQYFIYGENEEAGFSSFDMVHIRGILEVIMNVFEYHPFISLFKKNVSRSPSYLFITQNGVSLESINMNVASGKRAGDQFFQKHFKRLYIEEQSKENQIIFEKRQESRHELNCVERISGMTNFTAYSPSGKLFKDPANKKFIINMPAYVRPTYDVETEETAIKKYNGRTSVGYRVFIGGEIIEDGIAALDMEKIRRLCYPHNKEGFVDETKAITNFELTQDNWANYRNRLIVERPGNVDKLMLASDIGDIGGITEIIVMGLIGQKWKYLYNITLRSLDNKQAKSIFKYLYQRLKADKVGLDCSDGSGKAIFRDLQDDPEVDAQKLVWVDFKSNIEVGFEKNDKGVPVREKNGKLIKQYENTLIHSVQRLCYLLYEPLVTLSYDHKLDEQLDSVIAVPRGLSISYICASEENHLWQAFQVFAIMQWLVEFEGFSKSEGSSAFRSKHVNIGV